jgi:hypothetical protein
MSPEQQWAAYLDAIEASARAIARQAVDRRPPEPGHLVPPALPAVPWPAGLEERRQEVMASLVAATATVQACRDDAAKALSGLPRPGNRRTAGYLDGSSVDVVG